LACLGYRKLTAIATILQFSGDELQTARKGVASFGGWYA
jgi:hypothetical protein